jgi:drug/metabolite transporter (DMT)-like permease
MLDALIDSPPLLAAAIAIAAVLNYVIGLAVVRGHSRQEFIERDDWTPPGIAGKARSNATQLALPFAGIAVVILLLFVMDRFARELIGGGVLVMQLATLGSNVADLLTVQGLQRPDAAEGHLRYSAAHRFRAGAARLIGVSITSGVVAILFGSKPFLIGAVLLLATAAGWHRRARQASRVKG